MSGGNQVPAGGPREARESLRGWLGRGLARPSVFLSEQRQALRHLVRLLTDVLANSKKKCRDIPRGVLRTLRAKARAFTGRVGRAGLSVFAGAQAQVREGGLHVLIVSFHERFRFPFSTFRRSLAGAPEGSRVQRSPGPKLLALFRQYFRNLPASSVSHINPWNAWNNGALLVCAEQRDFYRSSSKNPNRPLLMTENERTSFKEVVRSIRSRVRQGAQDAKRSDRRRSD